MQNHWEIIQKCYFGNLLAKKSQGHVYDAEFQSWPTYVEQTHTTQTDSNGSGQAVHEDKVATHSGSAVLATLTILTNWQQPPKMMMMMMMILKICVLRRCQGVQQPMTMPATNIADSNAWNSLHNSRNRICCRR